MSFFFKNFINLSRLILLTPANITSKTFLLPLIDLKMFES
jgi:hypothetical protein